MTSFCMFCSKSLAALLFAGELPKRHCAERLMQVSNVTTAKANLFIMLYYIYV